MAFPLPAQLSTDPNVNASAMAWAAQLVDELSRRAGWLPVQLACTATLTLTTADQDVAGCSVDLPAGTYEVEGIFDFFHSVNGGGIAVGKLNVAGTLQTSQALLLNSGAANGDRATVSQKWVVVLGAPGTVKLQATKTINAGTALAVITHTTLTYRRVS